jgi:hypothetical protein
VADIARFTAETFSERLGETFRVGLDDGGTLDFELATATPAPVQPGDTRGGRAPFTIVFLGPLEPVLPQRIYPLEHDSLGTFDLFIVPIGPAESRMQYEAVFS